MKNNSGNLLLEMAVIVLVASVIGLIWNHEMLYAVWSGKSVAAPSAPVSADSVNLPLPAGLAQAKYLYDRKQAVFVDARDELAFSRGRIKGAISLPVGKFEAKLAEFKKKVPLSDTLVIYCNGYGCNDSMTVGKELMANGYRQVLVFEGGYPEWKDSGYPMEGEQK
jgi:rhodanese-related sulfurtransferase